MRRCVDPGSCEAPTSAGSPGWRAASPAGSASTPSSCAPRFILFSIFFGVGVSLYLVLWLLMPDDRGRLSVERALKDGDGGSIFLLVVTVMAVLGGAPWWGGDFHGARIFGFALLVLGAWWFLTRTDTGRDLMVTQAVARRGSRCRRPARRRATRPPTPARPTARAVDRPRPADPPTAAGADPWLLRASPRPRPASRGRRRRPSCQQPPRAGAHASASPAGLLVLGLALVSGVVLHQVATTAGWAGNPVAIGIAAGVGVLGLAIVIAGLAGRRAGGLAFFAVVGMIAAIATTAAPDRADPALPGGRPEARRHDADG